MSDVPKREYGGKMTNKEKFKEIFGIEPDCGRCNPYPCEEKDCKYWEQCEDQPGCACDDWWDWEFEEPTTKNDLVVDCVSRKAVINQIFYSTDNNGDVVLGSALRERIARLPSVTPQEPRWILVSERLPENKETVLVTFKHFVSGNTIGLGSVILLRGKPHWHVREQNLGTYDVLAWMPLPKAYGKVEV